MRVSLAIVLIVALLPSRGWTQGQSSLEGERQGNPSREFIMSCTYGVLAGTLVGAASLAFTSKPGESLNRVARGASIGLYTGILLGLYVVYVVPGMEEKNLEEEELVLLPRFDSGNLDGAQISWTAWRF